MEHVSCEMFGQQIVIAHSSNKHGVVIPLTFREQTKACSEKHVLAELAELHLKNVIMDPLAYFCDL